MAPGGGGRITQEWYNETTRSLLRLMVNGGGRVLCRQAEEHVLPRDNLLKTLQMSHYITTLLIRATNITLRYRTTRTTSTPGLGLSPQPGNTHFPFHIFSLLNTYSYYFVLLIKSVNYVFLNVNPSMHDFLLLWLTLALYICIIAI